MGSGMFVVFSRFANARAGSDDSAMPEKSYDAADSSMRALSAAVWKRMTGWCACRVSGCGRYVFSCMFKDQC